MQWRNSYTADITYSKDDVVLYAGSVYISLRETNRLPTSAGQWLKIGDNRSTGLSVIDLGIFNAIDLLAGPQTLYTPSAGQFVQIYSGPDGFVELDNQEMIISRSAGVTVDDIPTVQFTFNHSVPTWNATAGNTAPGGLGRAIQDGSPIKAYLLTEQIGLTVLSTLGVWQSNHVYADKSLILGPDDHIWSSSGGTSSGSIPDFAGNEGSTVVDNDITWTDEAAIPTQGSIHLYALVS